MTRTVTLSYEDAAAIAHLLSEWCLMPNDAFVAAKPALGRLADALDEAEARMPSGLFPDPVIIGPSGIEYRVRSRAEDAHD